MKLLDKIRQKFKTSVYRTDYSEDVTDRNPFSIWGAWLYTILHKDNNRSDWKPVKGKIKEIDKFEPNLEED